MKGNNLTIAIGNQKGGVGKTTSTACIGAALALQGRRVLLIDQGWSDAAVLIPFRYWKRYGDKRLLEECYGMMRDNAMFMIRYTGHKDRKQAKANPFNKYVYEKGVQLGEWLEPEEFKDTENNSGARTCG